MNNANRPDPIELAVWECNKIFLEEIGSPIGFYSELNNVTLARRQSGIISAIFLTDLFNTVKTKFITGGPQEQVHIMTSRTNELADKLNI